MTKTLKLFVVCYSLLYFVESAFCQNLDSISAFRVPIELDSFVVKSGFDVNAFIKRVQTDTTFYKSFRSLHLVPFEAQNNFTVYDVSRQEIATYKCKTIQTINSKGCRLNQTGDEKSTGKFFTTDHDFRYYTAELFFNLFYSNTPICNQNDVVAGGFVPIDNSRMERSKYELKQLIFNPGGKIKGVPLMGDRASVFDVDEAYKYDFSIRVDDYEGVACYIFSILPKPEYKHKVVYNALVTWFRRSDYSILARDYAISYNAMLYDFDVTMKVRTQLIKCKLYPVKIDYDGDWHILTKKRERLKVTVDFSYN